MGDQRQHGAARQGLGKDRRKCVAAADERLSSRGRDHTGEQHG